MTSEVSPGIGRRFLLAHVFVFVDVFDSTWWITDGVSVHSYSATCTLALMSTSRKRVVEIYHHVAC